MGILTITRMPALESSVITLMPQEGVIVRRNNAMRQVESQHDIQALKSELSEVKAILHQLLKNNALNFQIYMMNQSILILPQG